MLQQTQCETVIPFYRRFMRRFPSVKSLAAAPLEEVLCHWEGLGYYRRARALHAAAQLIVQQHGGLFPREVADLLSLPGIGRYTAHAIMSIANNARLPILEGNTQRLYTRLMNLHEDVKLTKTVSQLWDFAESIVPEQQCGEFNQALMDVGNQICRPKQPCCQRCPLRTFCAAYKCGTAELLPGNSAKTKQQRLFEAMFLIESQGKYLLRKCGENERWQGLFDFPRLMHQLSRPDNVAVNRFLQNEIGIRREWPSDSYEPFWTTTHFVTKYRIRLDAFKLSADRLSIGSFPVDSSSTLSWHAFSELEKMPLNRTARTALNHSRVN